MTTFNILKFAERLKELMEEFNYNTHTLAEAVFLTPGTISKYTNAKLEPQRNTIELLARHFQVNPGWLMGYSGVEKWFNGQVPEAKLIPFIETPNYPDKFDTYKTVPIEEDVDFCLIVNDNSMINARIFEGDVVYVRKQTTVETGEIAAIIRNGTITLKRIYTLDGSIVLHSENPTMPDTVLQKKEKKEITILGKVIYARFEVR